MEWQPIGTAPLALPILVCTENGVSVAEGTMIFGQRGFYGLIDGERIWEGDGELGGLVEVFDPIAWQPLPAPHVEQSND